MKHLNYLSALLFIFLLSACGDSGPTNSTADIDKAPSERLFVWNAMNFWYYWQSDIPHLSESYFEDEETFHAYLNSFSNTEDLFEDLQYTGDDFSFFIENYEEFEKSLQGTSMSFGFEFGLVPITSTGNELIGYVQYVLPDSPADEAGLARGDLFTGVNGTQLTRNNFIELMFNTVSYELTMAEIQEGTISETGETVSVQAVELTEDPVFLTDILEVEGARVGYLVYNAFQLNSHQKLNEVFGDFSSNGIDELVVDLRYNGGGTALTSQMLAGMISGRDSTHTFATYSYGVKLAQLNQSVPILNEVPIYEAGERVDEVAMNQLSLDRVFFLTGFGTASASEMLINGLEPYMDVILIGDITVGKDEGSLTLYDAPAPYLEQEEANPAHKMAIQPIVLKLVNERGEGYPDGFMPDYEVKEIDYLESGLPPLGASDEPLLARALEVIAGEPIAKMQSVRSDFRHGGLISDSKALRPHGRQLLIEPVINRK